MRRQCKACPWRKSTRPARDIPGGYDVDKHRRLAGTIAEPGVLGTSCELRLMACHESMPGREIVCVGWLAHQLGPGNNLPLRLAVIAGRIDGRFELSGAQHERFEDTLPRGAR
jgi:Family of unknown function (DUF6283)